MPSIWITEEKEGLGPFSQPGNHYWTECSKNNKKANTAVSMPKLDPPKAEKVGHDTIWRSKPFFFKVGGKELSVKELNGLEKQEVEVKSIIVQSFLNQKGGGV